MRRRRAVTPARRAVRWSGRVVGLAVVLLLVAGIGVDVPVPAPEAPVYSASEQAQLDAEGRYRALAAEARAAAGQDPTTAELMTAIAQDLEAQADAVSLPRSPVPQPARAIAWPTAAPAPVVPVPASLAPASLAPVSLAPVILDPVSVDGGVVLAKLRTSALRSLREAVDADPGPSHLLASAGANQWHHTMLLADALGTDAGLPAADTVPPGDLATGTGLFDSAVDGASDAASGGASGGASDGAFDGLSVAPAKAQPTGPLGAGAECAGVPLGQDADRRALLKAKNAEDRARYGYEVAAALLPDPAPALSTAAVHEAAADAAAVRLVEHCVPAAPAPAGFAVGPTFRADPAGALRLLEQDHAAFYAGLVPSVSGETRVWAILSFNAAVQRSVAAGTPLQTFPGVATGPHLHPDATGPPEPVPPPDDAAAPSGPAGG